MHMHIYTHMQKHIFTHTHYKQTHIHTCNIKKIALLLILPTLKEIAFSFVLYLWHAWDYPGGLRQEQHVLYNYVVLASMRNTF